MVVIDLDELIVPNMGDTWMDVLAELQRVRLRIFFALIFKSFH